MSSDAQRTLGRELARRRRGAGYTQTTFAPLTRYGRSTIANVETGRQYVRRDFWVRCDEVLDTGGALTRTYEQLEAEARDAARPDPGLIRPDPTQAAVDVSASAAFTRRTAYGAVSGITLDQIDADVRAHAAGHQGMYDWVRTVQSLIAYWDGRTTAAVQLAQDGSRHARDLSHRCPIARARSTCRRRSR